MEENNTKIWKTHGVFPTYEEAAREKESLTSHHQLVKIKRSGKGGRVYKVKFWNAPKSAQNQKKAKGKK